VPHRTHPSFLSLELQNADIDLPIQSGQFRGQQVPVPLLPNCVAPQ